MDLKRKIQFCPFKQSGFEAYEFCGEKRGYCGPVVSVSSRGGFRDLHAPLVVRGGRSREPGTASTYTINTRSGATTLIITLN